MEQKTISLTCPGCGGPQNCNEKYCEYCGRPNVIRSFTNIMDASPIELNKLANASKKYVDSHPEDPDINGLNFTTASCYLKLKLYDKAICSFEAAMEDNFDNADIFFYAAIANLRGKRPFLNQIAGIKKIIEYLNAALMIESKGIYSYLMAYVKYDFHEKKYLRISPTSAEELSVALINNVTPEDVRMLSEILDQEMPFPL